MKTPTEFMLKSCTCLKKSAELIACLGLLTVSVSADTNMIQGSHSIDWSKAGTAEAGLRHLERQMQRLEKVNHRINALPDFSESRPSMAVVKEHSGLLEIKARTLISIRRTSSRSADELLKALNRLEDISPYSDPVDKGVLDEIGMEENVHETYQKLRVAFDANQFNLQDAVLHLRMLAFAADRQVDYVRVIATNNRAALTRDFSQFTLRHGEKVAVKQSKDYSATRRTRTNEEQVIRTIVFNPR